MTHPRPRAHVPTSATVAVSRLGEVLSRSTAADVLEMRDAMARIVQEYQPFGDDIRRILNDSPLLMPPNTLTAMQDIAAGALPAFDYAPLLKGLAATLDSAAFAQAVLSSDHLRAMQQQLTTSVLPVMAELASIQLVNVPSTPLLAGRLQDELFAINASALSGWQEALEVFEGHADPTRLPSLAGIGRGVVGVGAASLTLTSDEPDEEVLDALGDSGEIRALLAREAVYGGLRPALATLDSGLVRRLDGAWERVGTPGPDAASQAANSLMELIDATLRAAAPDGPVVAWHARERRPADEIHNGRPTRTLRVRFILDGRPEAAAAVDLSRKALGEFVSLLQGGKHDTRPRSLESVAQLIPMVEGWLLYLLPESWEQER